MNNKYKTIEEMLKSFENHYNWWDKFILNPKMNWLRWLIYNLPDVPMDIYRNIKWFIQRGKRGYADCDVWCYDYYLSKIIVNGLKDLKFQALSVPSYFTSKEWKNVLDEIIWTFEIAQKIIDTEWIYLNYKERNKIIKSSLFKEYKYHVMTKEECLRYRNGWKLFQKYFFNLWD